MKKLILLSASLALLGSAGTALAAKDPVTIRHCGCLYTAVSETEGEATMVYKDITISARGGGHRNHVIDSYDDCLSGFEEVTIDLVTTYEPLYTTFVRDGDDCVVEGTYSQLLECDAELGPDVDDPCGSPAPE